MTVTASFAIAAALAAHHVDVVYCLPGEETIALLEAIDNAGIDLVVCRHEQHAAFMAAAHGRFTGRIGVVVTTLGPGFTNTITALAQATLCGFPVLALCGQKPIRDNDEGSFQVLDLAAIAGPVTKRSVRLTDPTRVEAEVVSALSVAMSPTPGAVAIEIPQDIATGESPEPVRQGPPSLSASSLSLDDANRIADRLARATSPVVLVGAAAQRSDIASALVAFAEAYDIGVLASQMGKGVMPEDHSHSLRSMSLNSGDIATQPLIDADVILAVGYQPVEYPPASFNAEESAHIIHVNEAPPAIERFYVPAETLIGDPASLLNSLTSQAPSQEPSRRKQVDKQRAAIEEALASEHEPAAFPPSALTVATTLRSILNSDDIVALDNGAYKVWFARHYCALEPNTLVLDNALATMGAGLATAMTAARLYPDRRVVAVCGDGGFMMNVQDLETAKRLGLNNLTILVLNDDSYGFIAWHQQERDRDRTAVDVGNPDFAALAESFGVTGRRVESHEALEAVLKAAIDSDDLHLVECPLDQSRNIELNEKA